ncbi:hypothetical protein FPANT_2427 [Fusarium pseudoanthophilum]|uniref:Uncharacterized protein n=1 Tax=Fusarium pseudoanthophilum TaxID=48495 RepID=A0A8H5PQ21_9HYPO|nr:hypothetical protein FPANT_2427 [Fusarium pseudoanthophilum]
MPEQRTPDVSKIDHGDSKARELYMMAYAGAINHFDYDRHQSASKLAMGNVCSDFARRGFSAVGAAYFFYKLDVAFWDIYFGDLGNDKPACPWTARPVQNDPNDEPSDDYIEWRRQQGMVESAQSQDDVSGGHLIAQGGISEDPTPTFESLQQAYHEVAKAAKVAIEMANKNTEMCKSMASLLEQKIRLQQKVDSLQEELARVESERNNLRRRLRDATFAGPRRQLPSYRQ